MSVNKKKILVVAQSYPTIDGNVGLMYIHTRNIKYIADGLNVTMLNFSAPEDYMIDGVQVITESTYKKNPIQLFHFRL